MRESVPSPHGLWKLEILFFPFIDQERSTHILCAEGDHFTALSIEEFQRTERSRLHSQGSAVPVPGS